MTQAKVLATSAALLALLCISMIPASLAATIAVGTDKTSYFAGELVTITGTADPNSLVAIQVTNPLGTIVFLVSTTSDAAGVFTRSFRLPGDAAAGAYTVSADGKQSTFQVVRDTTAPIIGNILFDKPSYMPADTGTITVAISDDSSVASAVFDSTALTLASGNDKSGTWKGSFGAAAAKGTYTITVTAKDPSGNTAVKSASYKVLSIGQGGIAVSLVTGESYTSGDTARIYAIVTLNGELTDPASVTGKMVSKPDGAVDELPAFTKIHTGWWYVDYKIPNVLGTYGVHVGVKGEDDSADNAQTVFQVKPAGATAAQVNEVKSAVQAVKDQVSSTESAITSAVSGVDSSVKSAQSDVKSAVSASQNTITGKISDAQSAITGTITGKITDSQNAITGAISSSQNAVTGAVTSAQSDIKSNIGSTTSAISSKIDAVSAKMDKVSTDMSSVNAAVGQSSTFILIVAALAAITLVLELVILVRKL